MHESTVARLAFARRALKLELIESGDTDNWFQAITGHFEDPAQVLDEINSVALVGETIGDAARSTLRRLKKAPLTKLVEDMKSRGFQFSSDAPARELHGALVKQAWARKDPATDEWEFLLTDPALGSG